MRKLGVFLLLTIFVMTLFVNPLVAKEINGVYFVNGKVQNIGQFIKSQYTPGKDNAKDIVRRAKIEQTESNLIIQGREDQIDQYLISEGLTKQKVEKGFDILSTKSDVSWQAPDVWYDNDTGRYYAIAGYEWQFDTKGNPKWLADATLTGDMGGYDAVGIFFTDSASINNIQVKDYMLRTYDSDNDTLYHWTRAEDWGSEGVVFSEQDKVVYGDNTPYNGWDYTFHKGYVSMWFDTTGPVNTGIKMNYVHTWDDAQISNVTVSTSGVSFSVTNSAKHWKGVTSPYYWSNY